MAEIMLIFVAVFSREVTLSSYGHENKMSIPYNYFNLALAYFRQIPSHNDILTRRN